MTAGVSSHLGSLEHVGRALAGAAETVVFDRRLKLHRVGRVQVDHDGPAASAGPINRAGDFCIDGDADRGNFHVRSVFAVG